MTHLNIAFGFIPEIFNESDYSLYRNSALILEYVNDRIFVDGEYKYLVEDMKKFILLSEEEQEAALKFLQKLELIEIERKGAEDVYLYVETSDIEDLEENGKIMRDTPY